MSSNIPTASHVQCSNKLNRLRSKSLQSRNRVGAKPYAFPRQRHITITLRSSMTSVRVHAVSRTTPHHPRHSRVEVFPKRRDDSRLPIFCKGTNRHLRIGVGNAQTHQRACMYANTHSGEWVLLHQRVSRCMCVCRCPLISMWGTGMPPSAAAAAAASKAGDRAYELQQANRFSGKTFRTEIGIRGRSTSAFLSVRFT